MDSRRLGKLTEKMSARLQGGGRAGRGGLFKPKRSSTYAQLEKKRRERSSFRHLHNLLKSRRLFRKLPTKSRPRTRSFFTKKQVCEPSREMKATLMCACEATIVSNTPPLKTPAETRERKHFLGRKRKPLKSKTIPSWTESDDANETNPDNSSPSHSDHHSDGLKTRKAPKPGPITRSRTNQWRLSLLRKVIQYINHLKKLISETKDDDADVALIQNEMQCLAVDT